MHRYNAEDIIRLNHREHQGERECSVCRRISKLQDEKCSICNALENMAGDVITHRFLQCWIMMNMALYHCRGKSIW